MGTRVLKTLCGVLCLVAGPAQPRAETVTVERSGEIDLAKFRCTDISQRGRISRVCYDGAFQYLLIRVDERYHHYCGIEGGTLERFLTSVDVDHYFGAIIENKHICRPDTVPKYPAPASVTPPKQARPAASSPSAVDD